MTYLLGVRHRPCVTVMQYASVVYFIGMGFSRRH